ncbi:MAG: ABC transporter ATP-binding protein [Bacteroidota bacterium]
MYKMYNVLDNLDLTLTSGKTYGLLGKNGAGKSTLINILTEFVQKDSGLIQFDGIDIGKNEVISLKKEIGLVSEENSLIEEFSGNEYLDFVGNLYKIPKTELYHRIKSLSEYFFEDLHDLDKYISKYSTGMKKKLEICAAVLHKPNFLILDEPFAGLDIVAVNQLLDFLKKYQNGKRIILISGHSLNYIDKIVIHILVLKEGKIIFDGSIEEFTSNGKESIDKSLFEKLGVVSQKMEGIEWVF